MKSQLRTVLETTIDYCFDQGLLVRTTVPDYIIEVPNNPDHGHFATNLPLTLTSSQKRSPKEIAATIVENLKDPQYLLEKTDIAGPGFINFTISANKWHTTLKRILDQKDDYGRTKMGSDEKVLVEFVSANPTGPLHVGHGRGAALGDTLCRILSLCGYDVVREFYINDAGQQISLLGESIFSRFKQTHDPDYPFPENGYHGDYISGLAGIISEEIDLNSMDQQEAVDLCARKGRERNLEDIKNDLALFKVRFDTWYSESNLFDSGLLMDTLDMIKAKGQLYEEDSALWIKTSDFGDDKDRVIRKKDGKFTYFASDIAYHLEKHRKGYTKAINLWGADHHGYVPRMKAALSAHGISKDWLSIMLIQLVKLWKGNKEIKMSKRAGAYVTLHDLIDEVGVDAARFVFLTKNHDSTLDFDIDLVKKENNDNP
ncbi:MAG: arginine--tRNA ligase, partial [Desulfobacterales bacterium]|nr:arginine--tRNA ligase [Desulfobacterales bacterium]